MTPVGSRQEGGEINAPDVAAIHGRRYRGLIGLLILTAVTGLFAWEAITADAYVDDAVRASGFVPGDYGHFKTLSHVAGVSSVIVLGFAALRYFGVVRRPSGPVVAVLALAHTAIAMLAFSSVGSISA
jgi:hypothetical protein